MTVAELIEELSKYPSDKKVMLLGDYYCRYLTATREGLRFVLLTDEPDYVDAELKCGLEENID